MPVHDELGKRMKEFYEGVPKTKLMRRCPVAIRLDGKAFHTFTRNFQKPFDEVLIKSMQETMKYLCENIQGCVLGYTQSDEITLILVDYKKLDSQQHGLIMKYRNYAALQQAWRQWRLINFLKRTFMSGVIVFILET